MPYDATIHYNDGTTFEVTNALKRMDNMTEGFSIFEREGGTQALVFLADVKAIVEETASP